MKDDLRMHTSVALLTDTRTTHFERGEPVLLRRGDTGTIVMTYDDGTFDVEFSDRSGRTYALLTLAANSLLVLNDAPERASV
jgi:hypothetical protein